MKNRLYRTAVLILFLTAFILPGCDFIETCAECEKIVEINGVIDESRSGDLIYPCGAELIAIENFDEVNGNEETYYNCY